MRGQKSECSQDPYRVVSNTACGRAANIRQTKMHSVACQQAIVVPSGGKAALPIYPAEPVGRAASAGMVQTGC